MKVLALAADEGGSGFYRMSEPTRVAKDLGVDVRLDYGIDVEAYENKETNLVEVKEINEDIDLLIIQRPTSNAMSALIQQAKKQGIATIVELDDDFDTVHSKNVAKLSLEALDYDGPHWIHEACRNADHVIVSTPRLLKYALHGRGTVLRNQLPQSIFDIEPVSFDNGITLGWTGSVQTHPTDLQATKGRVASIASNYNLPFSVVGDGDRVKKNLFLKSSTIFNKTGWVDWEYYYGTMSQTFNLGIVPLEISNFNHAKSSLKGMEMGALGIPFVASATSEYTLLELNGIGKVARSPGDWSKYLSRWIDNPAKLQNDARNYRDILYNGYTYEKHASDWVSVWEQTVNYVRK